MWRSYSYILYKFGELQSINPGDFAGILYKFCHNYAIIWRSTFSLQTVTVL